jgi:hypothetical protein
MNMHISKAHTEFYAVSLREGWSVPPGYPPGIEQKILSGSLDESGQRGFRSRLLRFAAGVFTTLPFIHEYWEEVYLVEGDLIVGNDSHGNGGETFGPHTYACRPPGTSHGPFKSNGGCILFELHYYAEGGGT